MSERGKPWSIAEVEATVQDYFAMLYKELSGQPYNKSQHRRTLREKLNNRSDVAIERKRMNISAVLIDMRLPWISGYKPLSNYQRILAEAVTDCLDKHPELYQLFQRDVQVVPSVPSVEDFLSVLEKRPERKKDEGYPIKEAQKITVTPGIDYLELEARNQALGMAGEQFVINFEKARLIHEGRENLADRIEQVSVTVGPSAGFDILSFEADGSDRYIEAKTTKYGKYTPFYITRNELHFSREKAARYHLYRVFSFRQDPRLFTLQGAVHDHCVLAPSGFRAGFS